MVLVLFTNTRLARVTKRAQKVNLGFADQRLELINEALRGIRSFKLFGWEPGFESRVAAVRDKECAAIFRFRCSQVVSVSLGRASPALASCVAFMACFYSGEGDLDYASVFAALSVFQALRVSMIMLPQTYMYILVMKVSFDRLDAYLFPEAAETEEQEETSSELAALTDATFVFPKTDTPALEDVTLCVRPGEVVAVVRGLRRQRAACARLRPVATAGDLTEVGERGVTLSGGQQARVSLCRALYARPDLLVADDPLSALDVRVAAHVFEAAFRRYASPERGVLLALNQMHLAAKCDRVVVVVGGRVVEQGPPGELSRTGAPHYAALASAREGSHDSLLELEEARRASPKPGAADYEENVTPRAHDGADVDALGMDMRERSFAPAGSERTNNPRAFDGAAQSSVLACLGAGGDMIDEYDSPPGSDVSDDEDLTSSLGATKAVELDVAGSDDDLGVAFYKEDDSLIFSARPVARRGAAAAAAAADATRLAAMVGRPSAALSSAAFDDKLTEKEREAKGALVEAEFQRKEAIAGSMYRKYLENFGVARFWCTATVCGASYGCFALGDWSLSRWIGILDVDGEEKREDRLESDRAEDAMWLYGILHWDTPATHREPPAELWPSNGSLRFADVTLRYRPGLPPALEHLNLYVEGGTRVGVIGRTGAGKSSLVALVLRLVEPEAGRVLIDGLDVAFVGLCALRKRVSMVPQDNVLLSGSVDRNLDPFEEHGSPDKRRALDAAGLGALALDHVVKADGGSLSAGEKQLLGVARALLRKTKVVVMDEPSSNVDEHTDAAVQRVLKDAFVGTTSLTIAHRLETVIDSDMILTMDAGAVAEFDHPANLLDDPDSRLNLLLAALAPDQRAALLARAKPVTHGSL
ncbi:ATPase [Aureococcus anophagefferens]|nr:ATPase [Aureococcus anophagefferens]